MKKRFPLIARILAGFVLGAAAGVALSQCQVSWKDAAVSFVDPFGRVLVSMLKMVVYPVILFSLLHGAASMPLKKAGRVGMAVMAWYFATSVFATAFGVFLAYAMNPSIGGDAASTASEYAVRATEMKSAGAGSSFADFIVNLFQNPFTALSNGEFLPIIIFAILLGLALRTVIDDGGEKSKLAEKALDVVDGLQQAVFRLIEWVVLYFPIGVFALSFTNFAKNGVLLFGSYFRITVCVAVGVCAMIFIVYPAAIALFCRENPFKVMYRIRQAALTAFVTRSSAATLPVSFKTMDELKVGRSLTGFSLPMGATINMDGVCIHLPVFVILAANMFSIDLSAMQVLTLCLSIVFASVGAGGIPGGSVFLLFMILENMGLGEEQVTLIVALALGINPILDMFETSCNVTGDNVCTYIVARKSGLIG